MEQEPFSEILFPNYLPTYLLQNLETNKKGRMAARASSPDEGCKSISRNLLFHAEYNKDERDTTIFCFCQVHMSRLD